MIEDFSWIPQDRDPHQKIDYYQLRVVRNVSNRKSVKHISCATGNTQAEEEGAMEGGNNMGKSRKAGRGLTITNP